MAEASFFKDLNFYHLAAKPADCPNEQLPEIIMAGRSNVGKSTLINALAGQKHLARVSSTPGKTRQVIYYKKPGFALLTDLPGYGFAKVSKAEKARFSELVEGYFALDRPIALVLLLLDIRHAPNEHDIQMIDYMREAGLPFALVFTKCDKLSRAQANREIQAMYKRMHWDDSMGVFAISALKRLGVEDLEAYMRLAVANFQEKTPESDER